MAGVGVLKDNQVSESCLGASTVMHGLPRSLPVQLSVSRNEYVVVHSMNE
jgi:hypothetical protein